MNDHQLEVDDDLLALAQAALHRIGSDSELKELWEETDDFDAWSATLTDLKKRLDLV